MVRDGMFGGSNRPLRRQEKGKMEALGSSPALALSIGDKPRASMRHPPPGRDSNGLKCRKSEIGDIFLFPARTWQGPGKDFGKQAIIPPACLRFRWLPAPRPGPRPGQ